MQCQAKNVADEWRHGGLRNAVQYETGLAERKRPQDALQMLIEPGSQYGAKEDRSHLHDDGMPGCGSGYGVSLLRVLGLRLCRRSKGDMGGEHRR